MSKVSNIRLLFLINGSEESAAGVRARMLAQRLPSNWQIHLNYRPASKWRAIVPFIQSALRFQPDIVYVMDTAYTGVLAAVITKRFTDCKMMTDTGDVAFELAKSTGTYSNTQLALINWIEQLAIRYSDRLVVRGSNHKVWLTSQGVTHVEFVPDGVDTTEVAEVPVVDASPLRKELSLNNCLVVGMVGTMSWSERHQMCYGWDIVEALALLKDVPIKGLLVGDGDGRAILEQRARQLGVENQLIFAGKAPYTSLPAYLAAMDVCVSTQSNDLVGMVRTTGKLPLYLAHGKYVIATDVGEASRVLPGIGCLLPYTGVRDDEHPARLAGVLKNLLKEPHLLQVSGNAKQVAKANFDYGLLARRVENICRELVDL